MGTHETMSVGARRLPPVEQREWIPELLDALIMGRVAGHQLQAVPDGEGGDHRISSADGLADPIQVTGNAAGKFSSGLVKGKDFFGRNDAQESLQSARCCGSCESPARFP